MILLGGVDVGASHTEAVVADESSRALSRRSGPAAALMPGHAERTADIVADVVRAALRTVTDAERLDALVVGAAGAGRRTEQEALAAALRSRLEVKALAVTGDGEIALESAFGGRPGIIVMAGSGSVAYARDANGVLWRAGGLGPQLGDEGSGYALARAALGAVGRAADGRGPPTTLLEGVLKSLGLGTFDDLIRWAQAADRRSVAALAEVVCHQARQADAVASDLVRAVARDLVHHVGALMARFPETARVDVALSGGLLDTRSPVRVAVVELLGAEVPAAAVTDAPVDPPLGAVSMAARIVAES